MPSPRRRSLFTVRITIAAVLLAAGGVVYAGLTIGRFLAAEDPLVGADAIFVLAGTRVERPLEAVDLYAAQYAPRIVLTRALSEHPAAEAAAARGARIPDDLDLTRSLLLDLGVPAGAIITPDRIHDNTAAEARTLRDLTTEHGWTRVIVVSSKYHLRRARMAARRALRGTDVQVIMRGSRYDPSTPHRWWQRRADIRWLASEVPKLAVYAVGLGD